MRKNFVILSESRGGYSNEKILQELTRRGHNARVVLPGELAAITRSRDGLFENGKRVYKNQIDGVIARGGAASGFGLAMLRHFEENMGVPVLNGWEGMMAASDKFLTHQILSAVGVPSPKTLLVMGSPNLDEVVSKIGSFPVIVKPLRGSQGRGVVFVPKEGKSAIEAFAALGAVIVQEYTPFKADVRAIVLNGQVIGAMERVPMDGDFRANISRGAIGRQIVLSKAEKELCSQAAAAVKLTFAGVDLLRLNDGRALILEVNGSPGLKISEVIPGAGILQKLGDYIETMAGKKPAASLEVVPGGLPGSVVQVKPGNDGGAVDSEQFEYNKNADKALWWVNA
jgi:ribosomal protein S6--L-glutamate ligase